MLRLSKKTDYALMAMKHLASDPRRREASARDIAESYDIPIRRADASGFACGRDSRRDLRAS